MWDVLHKWTQPSKEYSGINFPLESCKNLSMLIPEIQKICYIIHLFLHLYLSSDCLLNCSNSTPRYLHFKTKSPTDWNKTKHKPTRLRYRHIFNRLSFKYIVAIWEFLSEVPYVILFEIYVTWDIYRIEWIDIIIIIIIIHNQKHNVQAEFL